MVYIQYIQTKQILYFKMYNFKYTIKPFETNEEYQDEVLNVLNIDSIHSPLMIETLFVLACIVVVGAIAIAFAQGALDSTHRRIYNNQKKWNNEDSN